MSATLPAIYGETSSAQKRRYRAAKEAFVAAYGPGEVLFFRAPGRVNLIGEHTDYNQGFVLPAALDKDILLLTRPRSDRRIRLRNVSAEFAPLSFTISSDIPPAHPGNWGNYARGAAQTLARCLAHPLQGFDGLVAGQPPYGVPRAAGLSSSSALTVVVAVALAQLNDWQPERVTLARLCSDAEWYVGTRGGIMDQFIALLGQRDHALFLDCRPDPGGRYEMDHIPLPQAYRLLIADSAVRHQKARKASFNRRVAACRTGVGVLRRSYPGITHLRDVQNVPWTELADRLPQMATVGEMRAEGVDLGDLPGLTPDTRLKVRARCRHVWTENRRVLAAVAALRDGDIATLGRLLNQAHASARDDYAISCPELEVLVESAREVEGVAGARLTGAGWGGCIVAMVHEDAVLDAKAHVAGAYQARTERPPDVFTCQAAPGAGQALLS